MKVIVGGGAIELGTTEEQPTISFTDYSRRETDDFGVTTVVERGFARRMSVRLAVPFEDVDALQRRLADLRATPVEWIADDRFESLSFIGFYKDFSIDLAVPPLSFCTLTIEGLAETSTGPDAGGDPAPDTQASTLRLLQPATITDGVLTASSVPENDYPAWSAGTTYAHGVRVIRAHRCWESLIVANVGHVPAAGSAEWADIGPTKRWAMFDEALGTATQSAGNIVVTLDPVQAVNAIALLDVTSASVRVQAAGYDQTKSPVGSAGMTMFPDLPETTGAITITIAGSGVSVGTLLMGRLVGLGITEASPTAAITDYSRKETDDFGEVTVVERAWAKRMSVRALLRTDAVDLVAGRMATVRARPCLWIGADGLEVLSIYGFHKEFSIAVGENVSTLDLSVEGLSKAAPFIPLSSLILVTVFRSASAAPATPALNSGEVPPGWSIAPPPLVAGQYRWSTQAEFIAGKQQSAWTVPVKVAGTSWTDIIDNDPERPKPDNGATVGMTDAEADAVAADFASMGESILAEQITAGNWRAETDSAIHDGEGAPLRTVTNELGVKSAEHEAWIKLIQSVDATNGNAVLAMLTVVDGVIGGMKMMNNGELVDIAFLFDVFRLISNNGGDPIQMLKIEGGKTFLDGEVIVQGVRLGTQYSTNGGQVQTASSSVSGTGDTTYVTIISDTVTLSKPGMVLASVTLAQSFPSGDDTWNLRLRINGTVVFPGGGMKTQDNVHLQGALYLPAGTYTVDATWAAPSAVSCSARTLVTQVLF